MKRSEKNKREIEILLDNLKLAQETFLTEQDRIMWALTKYMSKTDLAKHLDIDRKTLYNRYFKKG